jgi:antitoxin PrlF
MPLITTKGQVTIPKELRDRFGLHPGESVEFAVVNGVVVVHKMEDHSHLDGWVGSLALDGEVDEFVDDLRGSE